MKLALRKQELPLMSEMTSPSDNSPPRRIKIFDTTLRDGEQSPGCSMNLRGKAGDGRRPWSTWAWTSSKPAFPSLRPATLRRCARSPARSAGPVICGLARCNDADIDRAWEALQAGSAVADSRLSGDQRDPPRVQAEDDARGDHRAGRRRREAGLQLLRRRGVLARGRRSHRARFSLRGRRSGHRRRGDDGQHSRHGRLCHAAAIRQRHRAC